MNILIVDDKPENIYIMEKMLKASGYDVISAKNGVEALEILKASEVDLVFSDILMPEMDGYQLCMRVKSDKSLQQIPFIFLTASYTEKKDEDLALRIGAERFLVSPVESSALVKIINEVTGAAKKSKRRATMTPLQEEEEIYKLYSERLVNKLEQKNQELEKEVVERQKVEQELREKLRELEVFYKAAMDREDRILELKKQVRGQEPSGKEQKLKGKVIE